MLYRRFIVAGCFILLTLVLPQAQKNLLSLEDIFHPDKRIAFDQALPQLEWMKDGLHYLRRDGQSEWLKVNIVTGKKTGLYNVGQMQAAFAAVSEIGPGRGPKNRGGKFTFQP